MSQICTVFLFHNFRIVGIKGCTYVRRKHHGVFQRSSEQQFAVLTCCMHNLCSGVFKETGLHASGSHTSDFLFIYQQTHGSIFHLILCKHCHKGRIRANTVVMSVRHNHASVQPVISCRTGWYDFKFCRKEVFLLHIIFFFQNRENLCFYRLFLFAL